MIAITVLYLSTNLSSTGRYLIVSIVHRFYFLSVFPQDFLSNYQIIFIRYVFSILIILNESILPKLLFLVFMGYLLLCRFYYSMFVHNFVKIFYLKNLSLILHFLIIEFDTTILHYVFLVGKTILEIWKTL